MQVMAEAADVGVRTILHHCQGGRVLQILADFMCKDKNPKIRQFGATYLQVVSGTVAEASIWVAVLCRA